MDLCYLRPRAIEGVKKSVGTYATRDLGLSKASSQRRKGACKDLCYPRPRAVEGIKEPVGTYAT